MKKKKKDRCFICRSKHGLASEYRNEIHFNGNQEIHLQGLITDKNNKLVRVCGDCLASLFYSAAEAYLNPIYPGEFSAIVQKQQGDGLK